MTSAPTDICGHLDIEGCFNVRDAGGWATSTSERMRSGRFYRADEPGRMTAGGRTAIQDLGLRAVVDLRNQRQFERGPGFIDAELTHHVPLVDKVLASNERRRVDTPTDIVTLYEEMVAGQRGNVVRAVEIIAAHIGDGPVLVHCMAGKDRTGIVVALVQAAIGVPLDSIVEDYVRSDAPTRLRRLEMVANPLPDDPDVAAAPELIWTAPGEAMELFATRAIERFGSLDAWPVGLGVSPAAVAELRRHLLVD